MDRQNQDDSPLTPPIKQNVIVTRKCGRQDKQIKYSCTNCQQFYLRDKPRILQHMYQKCSKRKIIKKQKKLIKQHQRFIQNKAIQKQSFQKQSLTSFKHESQIEKDLFQLKTKVNRLQNKPGSSLYQKKKISQDIALTVWQKLTNIVGPIIQQKISIQIQQVIKNQSMTPYQIETCVLSNLISKFQYLPIKGLLTCWKDNLNQAISQIISLIADTTPGNKSRNKVASQFILQFDQYDLTTSSKKIVEKLKNQSTFKRSIIISFYKKLQKNYPQLSLKKLPRNLAVYTFIGKRQIMALQSIKKLIISKWKLDSQLACDMMAMLNFGLRKSQLMKIRLVDDFNKFVRYVKIFQQKTGNTTTRFVSETLIIMSILSNTKYPLTNSRLQKMRRVFIDQVGQFYGVRHVSLTALTNCVLTQSNLNLHKNANTTISRYIDLDLCASISKILQIEQFTVKSSEVSINYSSNYLHYLKNTQQYRSTNQIQLQLQEEDDELQIDDCIQDATLANTLKDEFLDSDQVSDIAKLQSFSKFFIFDNYDRQLLPQQFETEIQVLNYIINQTGVSIQEFVIQKQLIQSVVSYSHEIKSIAQVLKNPFKIIKLELEGKTVVRYQIQCQEYPQFQNQQRSLNEDDQLLRQIAIVGIKNRYKILQNLKQCKFSKIIKEPMLKNRMQALNNNNTYWFTNSLPYCIKCFQSFLQKYQFDENSFFKCQKCKTNFKISKVGSQSTILSKQITIDIKQFKRSKIQHKNIKSTTILNNLMQNTQIQNTENITKYLSYYSDQIPKHILTTLNVHSKTTCLSIQQIIKNQSYLPLTIDNSKMKEGQKGIFATEHIKEDKILLIYRGLLRTNRSISSLNKNNILLGSLIPTKESSQILELYISTDKKFNSCKYIQSSYSFNCKFCLGLLPINQFKGQLVLYLYSTQHIRKGSEILYDHGSLYDFNDVKSQQ